MQACKKTLALHLVKINNIYLYTDKNMCSVSDSGLSRLCIITFFCLTLVVFVMDFFLSSVGWLDSLAHCCFSRP